MRAIRVAKFGGPEVLDLVSNVDIPKPEGKQVLVKVATVGVNPVDTYVRAGSYGYSGPMPITPGSDFSGTIHSLGSCQSSRFKVGDKVFGIRAHSGSYAEYCTVDIGHVGKLNDTFSYEQGASIGIPYCTAYRALVLKANAKPGSTVLVHGASGGVGLASVQLAKHLGLKVFGTAGTSVGIEAVKKCGAETVFNHKQRNYIDEVTRSAPDGFDVILEMFAHLNLNKDLGLLKKNGCVVVIGSRGSCSINPGTMMMPESSIHAVAVLRSKPIVGCRGDVSISPRQLMRMESRLLGVMLHSTTHDEWKEMISAIEEGQKSGWLKPVISKTYPLADAASAHRDIMDPGFPSQGNLVLRIH